MAKRGSGNGDLTRKIQEKFPKFSKVTMCMIANPEYGVDFSEEAKVYLGLKKKPKKRKPDRKRLTVRVPDEIYDSVKQLVGKESYQKLIEEIIANEIERRTK